MTTKEMIEVMQAYERGEEIEMRLADCEDRWAPAISPYWNWARISYRIKPKETKFKVGDVLVRILDEAMPLFLDDIFYIVSIGEEYRIQDRRGDELSDTYENIKYAYIKADDVLWYWEYQDVSGEWEMTSARYTKSDLSKEVLGPNERETAMPLYALGFRLPEKIGD